MHIVSEFLLHGRQGAWHKLSPAANSRSISETPEHVQTLQDGEGGISHAPALMKKYTMKYTMKLQAGPRHRSDPCRNCILQPECMQIDELMLIEINST